jgi:hypothetical protein
MERRKCECKHTSRRRPGEDEEWGEAAIHPGVPKTASKAPGSREAWHRSSQSLMRKSVPQS